MAWSIPYPPAAAQTAGTLVTVAGGGTAGFTGDGGPANAALLHYPEDIAVDGNGVLYISDSLNHRIRRVQGGVISTLAGTGAEGFFGDNGSALAALLHQPEGIAVDALGHLYVADYRNHRVRRITAGGRISTLAGSAQGFYGEGVPAQTSALRYPLGVSMDPWGNLLVADTENFRVRRVHANGIITTLAGSGVQGYSGDSGDARAAQLGYPTDAAVDLQGNVYIADSQNHVVRKVDPQGIISTYAGNSTAGYSGDGFGATTAQLDTPTDVAVDSAGSLYIADSFNHVVRKVDPTGIITTVAGSGEAGYTGDGGPATAATLNVPLGVEIDREGHLYIADNENHAVRMAAGIAAPGIAPGAFLTASGDVDRDGSVNVQDAILVLRASVGQGELTAEQILAADLNADAVANVQDAVLILRESVGLP